MFGKNVLHDKCNSQVFMVKDQDTEQQVLFCPGCRHDVDPNETHLEPEEPYYVKPLSRFENAW